MCPNSLTVCTSCMAYLSMGGQTVILVDDRHTRIKSKFWLSRTSFAAIRKTVRQVAVSAGCSKSTAQSVLTADLGLLHVSAG